MTDPSRPEDNFSARFLLVLVLGVTLVFLAMIRDFLVTILLAGIFAAMLQPIYAELVQRLKGRRSLAAGATVLGSFFLIFGPLSAYLGFVATQALEVTESVRPWIERQLSSPDTIEAFFSNLPLVDRFPVLQRLIPDTDEIVAQLGEAATFAGTFLVNSVASVTRGTTNFFLQLFVLLYAMFFFLIDGPKILDQILYYMPLTADEEEVLAEKFVSVTRATLRGSIVIGTLQGALAGIAFAVIGVEGAAFWATVMAVLSVIPGIGAALVWVPVSAYLLLTGEVGGGIALAAWCAVVVGTIDNFLRPRLVGRDAKMSDLMILVSTLGGIFMFGAVGFILGPIVAALFVAVWDLYGRTFASILPPVRPRETD